MGEKAVSSLREIETIGQSQYKKCVDERVMQYLLMDLWL